MNLCVIQLLSRAVLTVFIGIAASTAALASATITIQNNDAPGVGFNDQTPVSPVAGNNGTTLGDQRLIAFQFAANIWGATLNSVPTITIRASWAAMPCTADSGTLASAGSVNLTRDFPNATFANTWYSSSLANALRGSDLNPANPEINTTFNVNVGTPGCLQAPSGWYLGLDGNDGNLIDLVAVALHEFAHGLGMQTFTNINNGLQAGSPAFPTIYDRFLLDNSTGKTWDQMTNAERAASAINTGHLVWLGANVITAVPSVLIPPPLLRVNSPPLIAGNYTVGTAEFGPAVSSPGVTANVSATVPADGCTALSNAGSVSGKIAFINRGDCPFVEKTKNAQNAGAVAVIIGNIDPVNFNPTIPPNMAGVDPTIVITAISLNLADANTLRNQLGSGINATISRDNTSLSGADGAGRPFMFAPNPVETGSSVSHFDTSAFPNLLMEPNISGDVTHNVGPPFDLTFPLLHDLGWTGAIADIPTLQFSQASFNIVESQTSMSVTVTRDGDTSGVATVDYATSDTAGTQTCLTINGQASSRCDYITTLGTVKFAAGETSQTILIPIVDDVHPEGSESFSIALSNPTGATLGTQTSATLTITDSDAPGQSNPIDGVSFFVRQHYIDFLNREPDGPGLQFWTEQITSCGANAACIEVKRINVSAAFFLSIEFQETGYLAYRTYKTAFGNLTTPVAPVPVRFTDFLRDSQRIGQGVMVGVPGWEAQLAANKLAYMQAYVQRSDFQAAYPSSRTPTQIVDQMNANAGGVLSPTERDNLIASLTVPTSLTQRAAVLQAIAEDADLANAEKNKAFVLMQYFGYLRRNPDDVGFDGNPDPAFDGFNFWLGKLNQFNGNFIQAEMVKAFIFSIEYRRRFGQ